MEPISFRLPLPPSVNQQYRALGGPRPRRVLTEEARRFRADARKVLARLDPPSGLLARLRGGFWGAYFDFYFPTPLRRDLDGGLKIALDVIADAFGLDDRYVVDLHLSKYLDPLDPRLEVTLEPLPDWRIDREYVVVAPRPSG